jgi:curved DNA-binding protein
MSNFYSTLGLDRSATADDIKRAYRKLASQHHPDRGGDTKTFQEIQAAYDTLGDPEKRSAYDNPQPNFEGININGWMNSEIEDLIRSFGFGGPFAGMNRAQQSRNKTLNIQTTISLEDAFSGKELMASIMLPSGREQLLEIKIPAGINDGNVLRLPNMGDDSIPNVPRGDIHLSVHVQPHPVFHRQGDDLVRTININCIDAMLGKVCYITSINGKTLEVKIPAGTQHGQTLAIAAFGMPNMADNRFRGRLLLNVIIEIPQNLSEHQISKLKEIFP